MPLTCNCYWEAQPGDHVSKEPKDYTEFTGSRRKRCASCGTLIDFRSIVAVFPRYRIPNTDVECKIYGYDGEIKLADGILCEVCADLFFSLNELGFCVSPDENQQELVADYALLKTQTVRRRTYSV